MKKRVGVVTATRAEYGLLKNVMSRIDSDNDLELVLFVTGTHLLQEYGYTVEDIVKDGFIVSEKIDMLMKADSPAAISKTMGMAAILFGDAFERNPINLLVVLGDRYELLPICQAAMCAQVPIAHISGGEATEGVIDEVIRHCVTKMSYIHFPSCEAYRKRIIQLGEHPDRVFNYGDVGVENILTAQYLDRKELEKSLGISLTERYFSVTFHPVTLEEGTAGEQIEELFMAIKSMPQYKFIVTKSNADPGNQIVNRKIDEFAAVLNNCEAFESLGMIRYLSLLKHSCGIIGNSSSGIIEAPILKIPTINIGDRQKGRLKANSIIDCNPKKDDIIRAINQATSEQFLRQNCDGSSFYRGGNTAEQIVNTIKTFLKNDEIDLKKMFYDIEFKY